MTGPGPAGDHRLIEELERSQRLGFLGPAPVDAHLAHARGFAVAVEAPPTRFLDLGSGGGVPGLVLAELWPGAQAVLLEAGERRCGFLREAVGRLGLDGRVAVVRQRAEEAGRSPTWRGGFDLVVARSFGPPAVTAECAAPFLRVGGRLVVSEPPADATVHAATADTVSGTAAEVADEPDDRARPAGDRVGDEAGAPVEPGPVATAGADTRRWRSDGLALLGLALDGTWRRPYGYQVLVQREPCPDRYPRRVGQVAKRPLF